MRALADKIGVSHTYVQLVLAGRRPTPTADVVEKIAKELGLNLDTLLVMAGMLPTYLRWVKGRTYKEVTSLIERVGQVVKEETSGTRT